MKALLIVLILTVTPAAAQAPAGYTYGRDQDGGSFWQQCNPDGYCFGRNYNNRSESKSFWFQQPPDTERTPKR